MTSAVASTVSEPKITVTHHAQRRPRRNCSATSAMMTRSTIALQPVLDPLSTVSVGPSGPLPGNSHTAISTTPMSSNPTNASIRTSCRVRGQSPRSPRLNQRSPTGSATANAARCCTSASVPSNRNAIAT